MPGNEPCPLCNRPASYTETRLPFAAKRFECGHCKNFVIDAAAEAHLAELPEFAYTDLRRALSDLSRTAAPGDRLLIREPYPGEAQPKASEGQSTAVTAYLESTGPQAL